MVITVLAITAIFIPVINRTREIKSKADITGESLIPARQNITRLLFLLFGILLTVRKGAEGLKDMSVLWSALLGISVYWYYYKVKK